jgi:chemosensory pili system protein ChpA (sensor histidine kinase/response regulator)
MDKEQKIRLQFLDEAQEYLKTLEAGFLGSGSQGIAAERMNALLRAAHSIKGGAAVMGFSVLSEFSHRLEDGLKVLRTSKGRQLLDSDLERLLLASVDGLRGITQYCVRQQVLDPDWIAQTIAPSFLQLHDRLGDPSAEDEAQLISEESGVNVALLMFETEVESSLQKLEALVADPSASGYKTAFIAAAEQLEPLGYMLDLLAFSSLCQDIAQHFAQVQGGREAEQPLAIATLQIWRRCQALVLIDQTGSIPDALEPIAAIHSEDTQENTQEKTAVSFDQVLVAQVELAEVPAQVLSEPIGDDRFGSKPILEEAIVGVKESPSVIPVTSPISSVPTKGMSSSDSAQATLRVAAQQVDHLSELLGELVTQRSGLNLNLQQFRELMRSLKQRLRALDQSNRQLRSIYDWTKPREKNDRGWLPQGMTPVLAGVMPGSSSGVMPGVMPGLAVEGLAGFDALEMDQYGELHLLLQAVMETIVQVQEVSEDLDTALQSTEGYNRALGRTTKQLQVNLSQLRMRPLADLVDRFPRAIREMSLKYNKSVELKIRGRSTLIEQSILEAISDPLLHLLRNAFDHGIEAPEIRQSTGKSPTGLIELSASYKGNYTFITLRDDGAGINLEKVKAKALKMGLSPQDIAQASEADLLDLIFEPGFSTAAQVTDLSGRGVGLDVVRNNLSQIKGDIQVRTEPGQGTTFTLLLPFSLSVIRVLLVDSHSLMLAIPANAVEEIILLPTDASSLPQTNGSSSTPRNDRIPWHDQEIPLVFLRDWLALNRSPYRSNRADTLALQRPIISQNVALVVKHLGGFFALGVDRYWREQEVSLQPVLGQLPLPAGFGSCAILSDGHLAPVLDPVDFLQWIADRQASEPTIAKPTIADLPVSRIPTVLVVDDSINVRRFLATTLEKAGYRVEQAKDGQDALEQLQTIGSFVQAIVSDVEMPRLDGFGLLAQIKSLPTCRNIPVIMLTSRSGEKHRRLAAQLGASAYFTKPYQEQDLLQTLGQLL